MPGPALGIVELSSIARGIVVADALLKKAPSTLWMSRPVSGGKHLVMLHGDVASVAESMDAALQAADAVVVDSLELPYAHDQLWPLLPAPAAAGDWAGDQEAESVAIVETATVCATVGAADAAAKTAAITLRDMRLAEGIAGKAYFTMTGSLADVEAAAGACRDAAGPRLLALELISAPAPELRGRLIF